MSLRTPSYRLHKSSGQAVVSIDGRDFYLGRHGSAASRAEYDRLIVEWLANGRSLPTAGQCDLAVSELILRYVKHADSYYRKNGEPTKEAANVRTAMKPLKALYGHAFAKDFGPLSLKAVRNAYVESGLCRNECNKRTRHVVRMFRWAVENEMVPASVHHGLKAVAGLRLGRSEARESEPVKPVAEAFVDAVQAHVSRQVWSMIQLQRLTGMRPGEVCQMRTCDLDMTGKVWVYSPASHKTQHHGKVRKVYLGPKAQAVARPWLRTELTEPLFQPREAMEEYRAELRRKRETPLTPSQRARTRNRRPRKEPGERYDPCSYCRAVKYGCKRAGIPSWNPHRLRHNAATWLRKEFGLEVAQVILGHSSAVVTEIYAEIDAAKALKVMEQVG